MDGPYVNLSISPTDMDVPATLQGGGELEADMGAGAGGVAEIQQPVAAGPHANVAAAPGEEGQEQAGGASLGVPAAFNFEQAFAGHLQERVVPAGRGLDEVLQRLVGAADAAVGAAEAERASCEGDVAHLRGLIKRFHDSVMQVLDVHGGLQ